MGGGSDVCHTLLGTGVAPGIRAAPSPMRSMTVPHSLTKPVWLMWMWGSLSGQWEGEVTLSHPAGTGGAPGIHVIYILSYILYYLAINHYQLNTMMIVPTRCTGWTEVQLRQISPTCHVIITSQDVLNIKSQTNLPIYPFFWTEIWNFYRQKSSYSIRSRQPEIIKILRPPKRILSSFPSYPKTT